MKKQQKAILLDLIHPRMTSRESMERMEELESLVNTYGGIVVVKRHQKRFAPHPRTFIGTGKAAQLLEESEGLGANIVVINDRLKPRQAYELSEILRPGKIQLWDRIDLILKIFSKHAKTAESKLEIELAGIRHMGPRIFGMGKELLRQAGGIGTRGLGETNTEIMKRHLRDREKNIKKKLKKYENVRKGHRANRRRKGLSTIAIVGYTNAGKTTLLNAMTGRKEYAANELFATLDTRVGTLWLPGVQKKVLLSDTIGFIQDLPPELLNAFASTLSEAVEADLLLHVVDASDKKALEHVKVVEDILERLGILDLPRIIVANKSDLGEEKKLSDELPVVSVSAMKKKGIPELLEKIEEVLSNISR